MPPAIHNVWDSDNMVLTGWNLTCTRVARRLKTKGWTQPEPIEEYFGNMPMLFFFLIF